VRVAELGQKPRAVTQLTQSSDRRRRADGERSRAAILRGATEQATLDGLEGLSIAGLADHIGMSKRPLRTLRLQGGAPARHDRKGAGDLRSGGRRARARAARGPRARARNVRRLSVLPRTARISGVAASSRQPGGVRHPRGPRAAEAPGVRGGGDARPRGDDPQGSGAGRDRPRGRRRPARVRNRRPVHGANAGFLLSGDREPLERARRAIRDRLGISRA
jgi:hypothetical protein